jgi:hypothetical protein
MREAGRRLDGWMVELNVREGELVADFEHSRKSGRGPSARENTIGLPISRPWFAAASSSCARSALSWSDSSVTGPATATRASVSRCCAT